MVGGIQSSMLCPLVQAVVVNLTTGLCSGCLVGRFAFRSDPRRVFQGSLAQARVL